MKCEPAIDMLARLHSAQNEFYAGGSPTALEHLLAPDVTWSVPGASRIAGIYRGRKEVLGYFRRRRDLAGRTFQVEQRDILVGEGDRVAALNDGVATIGGREHRWSTVGLYEVTGHQIAACWLLPLDQGDFDRIWSTRRGASG